MIELARLLSAHEFIDPVFLNSPVAAHAALDDALGCKILCKVETLNPIRSFKGRGTELFAARVLTPGESVVCASAGNFGQGLARAAVRRGHECVVFAATTANPIKVEAMRRLGARVVIAGEDFDAAKMAARQFAEESRQRFVEDGAEPAIAEGAGTLGLEFVRSAPPLETLFVPLGNGALLAGVGAAFRHVSPETRIVAVVADGAPSMKLSIEQGHVVETTRADTIADGVAVRQPIVAALAMLKGRFDEVVRVKDGDIVRAMRLVLQHLGLAIEPAGALGVAAVLANASRFQGQTVGTVLCGGNLAPEMLRDLVQSQDFT